MGALCDLAAHSFARGSRRAAAGDYRGALADLERCMRVTRDDLLTGRALIVFSRAVLDRGFPEHALEHLMDARHWLGKVDAPADVAAELADLEDRVRRAGGRATS